MNRIRFEVRFVVPLSFYTEDGRFREPGGDTHFCLGVGFTSQDLLLLGGRTYCVLLSVRAGVVVISSGPVGPRV